MVWIVKILTRGSCDFRHLCKMDTTSSRLGSSDRPSLHFTNSSEARILVYASLEVLYRSMSLITTELRMSVSSRRQMKGVSSRSPSITSDCSLLTSLRSI